MDKQQKQGLAKKLIVGSVLMVVAGASMATPPDLTAATTAFADVGTSYGTIGQAMVGAVVGGIVYKWITAFFI